MSSLLLIYVRSKMRSVTPARGSCLSITLAIVFPRHTWSCLPKPAPLVIIGSYERAAGTGKQYSSILKKLRLY